MSKIIEFLDQAGRDAALRFATREQLLRRMSQDNIGKPLQDAVLRRPQRTALATLLGARETMYCQNQSEKPAKAPAKKKAPPKKETPAKKKAPAKQPAKKAPKRKR